MGRIKKPTKCPDCGVDFAHGAGKIVKLSDTCAIECPYCNFHIIPYTCGCQYHANKKKLKRLVGKVQRATTVDELNSLMKQVEKLRTEVRV